jgi:hypothetical protein
MRSDQAAEHWADEYERGYAMSIEAALSEAYSETHH